MKKHLSIILRAISIFLAITFIEAAKEFKEVGAAKLHDYSWSDWLVLLVAIGAVGFVALNAFFSTAFAEHQDKLAGVEKVKTGHTDFIEKPLDKPVLPP